MNLSVIPDITRQGDDSPYAVVRAVTVGGLAALVREYAASPDEWWHLVRFAGTPVRLAEGVWLSAWPPGHRAVMVADVLTVVAGELAERTITADGVVERILRANRVRVHGSGNPRELMNPGPAYAVSLHAMARKTDSGDPSRVTSA